MDKKIKRAQKALLDDPTNPQLIERVRKTENERVEKRLAIYGPEPFSKNGPLPAEYVKYEEGRLAKNAEVITAEKELRRVKGQLDVAQKYVDNLKPESTELVSSNSKYIVKLMLIGVQNIKEGHDRLNKRLRDVEDATKKLGELQAKRERKIEWLHNAKNPLASPTSTDAPADRLTTLNAPPTHDPFFTHNTPTTEGPPTTEDPPTTQDPPTSHLADAISAFQPSLNEDDRVDEQSSGKEKDQGKGKAKGKAVADEADDAANHDPHYESDLDFDSTFETEDLNNPLVAKCRRERHQRWNERGYDEEGRRALVTGHRLSKRLAEEMQEREDQELAERLARQQDDEDNEDWEDVDDDKDDDSDTAGDARMAANLQAELWRDDEDYAGDAGAAEPAEPAEPAAKPAAAKVKIPKKAAKGTSKITKEPPKGTKKITSFFQPAPPAATATAARTRAGAAAAAAAAGAAGANDEVEVGNEDEDEDEETGPATNSGIPGTDTDYSGDDDVTPAFNPRKRRAAFSNSDGEFSDTNGNGHESDNDEHEDITPALRPSNRRKRRAVISDSEEDEGMSNAGAADEDDDDDDDDEEIDTSNFSVAQREVAFDTLTLQDNRKIYRTNGGTYTQTQFPLKADLLAALARSKAKIPKEANVRFVRKCKFSRAEVKKLRPQQLYAELTRLGQPTCNTTNQKFKEAVRHLEAFIDTNGLGPGCQPLRAKAMQKHSSSLEGLVKKAKALGISTLKNYPQINKLEYYQRKIIEAEEIHAGRAAALADPKLTQPIIIDGEKITVIIIARWSSPPDDGQLLNIQEAQANIEAALKRGLIIPELRFATFQRVSFCMRATDKIPVACGRKVSPTGKGVFANVMSKVEAGSRVVLVLVGLEGLSTNEEGWEEFLKHHQNKRISLLIGESDRQWKDIRRDLANVDWRPLEAGYHWIFCDLDALMANRSNRDVRVYNHILEQWGWMSEGREIRGKGIMTEKRPVAGRHGPQRSRHQS